MRFDVSNRDDAPSIVWHIIAPLLDPSRILMRDRHVLVHDLHVDPAVRVQFFFRWEDTVHKFAVQLGWQDWKLAAQDEPLWSSKAKLFSKFAK